MLMACMNDDIYNVMMVMQQKFVTQSTRWDGVVTVYVYKWKWYLEVVFKIKWWLWERQRNTSEMCAKERERAMEIIIYILFVVSKSYGESYACLARTTLLIITITINFSFQVFQPHRNKQNLTISHSSSIIIFLTSPPYVMMLRWIISLCGWVPLKVIVVRFNG